ncbi:hypothetical protein K8I85_16245, partial [bacterium]|nr:hypothetical protein [bacterium]
MERRAVLGVVVSWLFAVSATAATLHVPAEYSTIQAAMDVAAVGDTVLVAPGTYAHREVRAGVVACVFLADGVTLLGEGGPGVTTIDFGAQTPRRNNAFVYGSGLPNGCTIRGFTLQSSAALLHDVRGMDLRAASARVEDCVFIGLRMNGGSGAGITMSYEPLVLRNCEFHDCSAEVYGGALYVRELDAEGCLFEGCGSAFGAVVIPGSYSDSSYPVRLVRNVFRGNVGKSHNNYSPASLRITNGPGSSVVVEENLFVGEHGFAIGAVEILTAGSLRMRRNSFVDVTMEGAAYSPFVISAFGGPGSAFTGNIIAGTVGGGGASFSAGGEPVERGCNVFWDLGEAFGGPVPADFAIDPMFCDPAAGDFRLRADSPCLPQNHPSACPDPIGAFGEGCPGEGQSVLALVTDLSGPAVLVDGVAEAAPALFARPAGATVTVSA